MIKAVNLSNLRNTYFLKEAHPKLFIYLNLKFRFQGAFRMPSGIINPTRANHGILNRNFKNL